MRMMKIWLDDMRPAPEGWWWVKEAETLLEFLQQGHLLVKEMSLDHDLGLEKKTGMDVVDFLVETHNDGKMAVHVHSANLPARERMDKTLRKYGWPGNLIWALGEMRV